MKPNEEKISKHVNNLYKCPFNKERNHDISEENHSFSRRSRQFWPSEKPGEGQLAKYIDELDSKRVSTREWALRELVDALEDHVLCNFVENKSITMSMKFTNLLKGGSLPEVLLASRALGLLVLTDGCTRNAHEIMEYAIPHLSQAVRHKSEAVVAMALRTISILTFVGGDNIIETERSMKLIWDIINLSSNSENEQAKIHHTVLVSGVSSWSLLLSTIDGWIIRSKYSKGAIDFLLHLSCMYGQTVGIAAGKAIALILDADKLYKFTMEDNTTSSDPGNSDTCSDPGNPDACSCPGNQDASHIEASLKDKILNQVKNNLIESEKKELTKVPARLLKRFSHLKTTTQCQKIQFSFLRDYLGDTYVKHMLENELYNDIFYYVAPKTTESLPTEEKLHLNPFFDTTKERTLYRNKQRCVAKAKREGHFAVGVDARV